MSIENKIAQVIATIGDNTEDALDAAVHDCFSRTASNINNEGTPSQIRALLEHGFSVAEILKEASRG